MTEHSKAILKSRFEAGDTPDGRDFVNLIDSSLNTQDALIQKFTGRIATSAAIGTTVSAEELYVENFTRTLVCAVKVNTGSVNQARTDVAGINVADVIETSSMFATTLRTNTLTGDVTTSALQAGVFQGIRASSVLHKEPYASVYSQSLVNVTITTSAFSAFSADLTARPDATLGFTYNTATRVTYTGSTTAKMLVSYRVACCVQGCAAGFHIFSLAKNATPVPESRSTVHADNILANVGGQAIVKMQTSDFLQLNIKYSAADTYNINLHSMSINVRPVSWEF